MFCYSGAVYFASRCFRARSGTLIIVGIRGSISAIVGLFVVKDTSLECLWSSIISLSV